MCNKSKKIMQPIALISVALWLSFSKRVLNYGGASAQQAW